MTALSADAVCARAEDLLREHLPAALTSQGVSPDTDVELEAVTEWQQLPSRDALSTAALPAGAITTPGTVAPPEGQGAGAYSATWLLAVAVYARGADQRDTTWRVRGYAAAVRDVFVSHPTLGGLASASRWTHEEYALLDPKDARTIGGCLVEIEVDIARAASITEVAVPATTAGVTLGVLPLPPPVHPAL